jgi:hypothetical protein
LASEKIEIVENMVFELEKPINKHHSQVLETLKKANSKIEVATFRRKLINLDMFSNNGKVPIHYCIQGHIEELKRQFP